MFLFGVIFLVGSIVFACGGILMILHKRRAEALVFVFIAFLMLMAAMPEGV